MRYRITIRTALTAAAIALGVGGITTGIAVAATPPTVPSLTQLRAAANDSGDDAAKKRMDEMMETMTRNLPADQRAEAQRMHEHCRTTMAKH